MDGADTQSAADMLFARRASSFGSQAVAYAEHRPNYPLTGIRWVVEAARRPVRRVLDLAAGTGKLTEGLLALGLEVIAVEPNAEMLAELPRRCPDAPALSGTAERIPLAGETVDAVLVGQAFHWFDLDRALSEIARVLRPGGVVGALWNFDDDSVEWVAGLATVTPTSVSEVRRVDVAMPAHAAFGTFEREVFAHSHRRTADSLTATVGTHSHTLVISEEERAEVFARLRRYLASRPETRHGEFDLPLVTTVVRGVRAA